LIDTTKDKLFDDFLINRYTKAKIQNTTMKGEDILLH